MSDNNKSNNNLGYFFAILAVIIWSTNFIAAKYLTNLMPIEISFYRWLVTLIVLTPFCIKKLPENIKYIKGMRIKIIIMSILSVTLFNTFVYMAAHTSNAVNMSLLASLSPVVTALISRVVWKTKLTIYQKIGLLLVIIGVVILITKGSIEVLMKMQFTVGDIYMLFGVIIFSVYTLILRIKPKEIPHHIFFYIMVIIGFIPLMTVMIFMYILNNVNTLNTSSALILVYIGIFPSALGFILWNIAVSKIGAIKGSIIYDSVPFFSSLQAVILLNEKLLLFQVLGGILMLIGIIYSSIGDKISEKIKNNKNKKIN
ncbi:DMT family transporter [uncultured Brachyspira sp.]|uniref:DMT family transporter n=1 Tax=uncultured Brachyspira sp. TaxID=221953 RepID=UPI00262CC4EE|nr:DMT family transporter [uncultured Brachyspira sp.]